MRTGFSAFQSLKPRAEKRWEERDKSDKSDSFFVYLKLFQCRQIAFDTLLIDELPEGGQFLKMLHKLGSRCAQDDNGIRQFEIRCK